MLESLGQWKYPTEFRIPRPALPVGDLQNATQSLSEALRPQVTGSPGEPRGAPPADIAVPQLADLATELWRLRGKMLDAQTGRPREEVRRAFRHLEGAWESLEQAGVQIQDHARSAYDPGLSIQVLAFQPTPDLESETIIETIRPTIYVKGQRIQVGEVIVGTPERRSP